ncbi:P-loop containing nucleoside triphosphate hydrolase protein [Pseudoneurospora amorphoporcata]|uniref:P-loop containing nucleoside triphosphate hydrolase protein n=1 Tax=Pseudoneurospora amorphoporcata TaxID=241081 RepID=A0AAN6SJA9_9PEZI|nr:P-loop containing nucleoside triphosphate hydrolase protein [Pseudoneurospora amorphoporcata]
MTENRRVAKDIMSGLLLAATTISVYFIFRDYVAPHVAKLIDPDRAKHDQTRLRAQQNLARIQKSRDEFADDEVADDSPSTVRVEDLVLNEYESQVALEVVAPEDIPVGFDDIGGLDEIIEEVKEAIIYPLTMPQLYSHGGTLLSAPSGVLLYGPPGCGKTMLAKAVAHESGASFINLHISTLTEKWYGDSNKLVRAVFSLALKLQPAIIFIDEIDAVLGTRRSGEHEASGMVKAEFMTLWDGLTSTNSLGQPARIMVLGATNRINDIDDAILRRMPKKFPVPLPGKEQRRRILELVLAETKCDPKFDLEYIALVTEGMSGSELKEACRDAAMVPMREAIRNQKAAGRSIKKLDPSKVRGLRTEDFFGRKGGAPSLAADSRPSSVRPEAATSAREIYEVDTETEDILS